jgi:carbon monoxide dehydrogenase subunit G
MQLQNSFSVSAPIDQVWDYFKDTQRVANCVPGADLDQVINPNHFKGKVKIKAGPINLAFKGELQITDRNEGAKRVVMKAKGNEERGKGNAEVQATAQLSGGGGSTSVTITQDITMSGAVAQMGRGAMSDVTAVLIQQFGKCIEADLAGKGGTGPKSISGMGLMAGATKQGLKRVFGGGGKK